MRYSAVIVSVAALLVCVYLANAWKRESYSLVSGKRGGGYHDFAVGLASLREYGGLKVDLVESEGSLANVRMLERGEADFGLIQQGVEVDDSIRAVAALYPDIVHLLVRTDTKIESITELQGMRVSLGMQSSGTRLVAEQLLDHYGLDKKKLVDVSSSPRQSVQDLIDGKADVMIMVTALRAPVVIEALESGKVEHLSLGEAEEAAGVSHGIASRYGHLKPVVIPKHAFGKLSEEAMCFPKEPIAALALPSWLVCRADISDDAVYEMTKSIYTHRYQLGKSSVVAQQMYAPNSTEHFSYPLHQGAWDYYHRKDPGFLVVYAEVIALILSVLIAVVTLAAAIHKWVQRRVKNRIDHYYEVINQSFSDLETGKVKDFKAEEEMLMALKHKAINDLVAERLNADESFRILQDLLEQCLNEVQRRRGI
ncbi:TAXI family TRAP transporter solute-binding subunit [Rubritalea tangerina]|uniref:TAXI family TRAP transporter solute-binding subunit n=2 Tax=Rubritalea tangerina TaxID=430798 RepID=A0ABW4ZCS7_9BACT